MALGKYSRIDGKKSSSYCSTATVVAFVSLCLVGVWMMTSYSVVPVLNIDMSSEDNKNEVMEQASASNNSSPSSENSESNPRQFEDNHSNLPEDSMKVDNNLRADQKGNNNSEENPDTSEKVNENATERDQEEKPENKTVKVSAEEETKSEGGNRTETENGEGKVEDRESNMGYKDFKSGETGTGSSSDNSHGQGDSEEVSKNKKSDPDEGEKKSMENRDEKKDGDKVYSQTKEVDQNKNKEPIQSSEKEKMDSRAKDLAPTGVFPSEPQSKNENKEPFQSSEKEKMDSHNQDLAPSEIFPSEAQSENENKEPFQSSEKEKMVSQTKDLAPSEVFPSGAQLENGNKVPFQSSEKEKMDSLAKDLAPSEVFPSGAQSENENKEPVQSSEKEKMDSQAKDLASSEVFPSGSQSELLNETTTQIVAWSTQGAESRNEKEAQKSTELNQQAGSNWKVCNVTAGPDYIPCLDNLQAIRNLPTTKHYEHRERHCPEDPPTCLVSLPEGYQRPIKWPTSREKVWYHNVPHSKLVKFKGHQNWVKINGDYLTFPGGGTQFKHGALHYIDFIQESTPDIAWGKRTRVVLDVGCGVASFGGFLFERDVVTMSLAPKDEHEAQVQFALERGIPAISAVMGTKRLPFPGRVFDVVHCARCRVPWHIEGGKLLLELNRLLRPGGFFIWSATPVYPRLPEDPEIWEAMSQLTKSMCWELVQKAKDRLNRAGIAIFRKPTSNECYEKRSQNEPSLCQQSDDPNAAWKVPLQTCMHKVPVNASKHGSQWPEQWPARGEKPPYWLLGSQVGVYGKAAPEDFAADYEHWKHVVTNSYLKGMGVDWLNVRNVMDMKAVYGGFAAALRDLKVWVMNVVPIDSPDTLPIIYERGLFGIYHDWCESFSTYPRSYDLLHADHLFSKIKKKCNFVAVVAEVDRILRPEGKLIVRDELDTVGQLENLLKSMHWEVRFTYTKENKRLLFIQKTMWRPTEVETVPYAIS